MKHNFKELFGDEYDDLVGQAEQSTFLGYDMKEVIRYGTTNDILFVIQMICNQYNDMLEQERRAIAMMRDISDARIRVLGG